MELSVLVKWRVAKALGLSTARGRGQFRSRPKAYHLQLTVYKLSTPRPHSGYPDRSINRRVGFLFRIDTRSRRLE